MRTKLLGFKAFAIIAIALTAAMFTGCDNKDNTDSTLPTLNIISPETGETDNSLSLTAEQGGGTISFAIQSNRSWTVSSNAEWAKVSPESGNGNGMVTVTVESNDGALRVANITVKNTTITRVISISQSGSGESGESMTIAQFREKYYDLTVNSGTTDTNENPYIELTEQVILTGTVISDAAGGNVQNFLFMMQDATTAGSGICISTKANHGWAMGDKVMVTCEIGRKVKIYNGLMQLEATEVLKLGSGTADVAEVAIADLSKYESQLVKISGVQTNNTTYEKWQGGQGSTSYYGVTFENQEGETVVVYVKSGASFADQTPLTGNGSVTGIVSLYFTTVQLQPRNAADVADLTGERFEKETIKEGQNVLFAEDFGKTDVSANTNVSNFTGWSQEGLGAANVTYSEPFSFVTIRKTGVSSGYEGASGGNNAFFGTYAGGPTLIISDINLGGAKNLYLGFGSNTSNDKVTVSVSTDNESTWQPVDYTKKSTVWDYVVTPITLTDAAAEISIKIVAVSGAQARIDDIKLSTDDAVNIVEIIKPTVTTAEPVADYTSIMCNGSYTYEGTATDITEMGFYLDGIKTPTTSAAEFSYEWTGLEEATTHTIQAYAVCNDVIYKGEEISKATLTKEPAKVLTVAELVALWSEEKAAATEAVGLNMQVKGVVVKCVNTSTENLSTKTLILTDNNGAKNSGITLYNGTLCEAQLEEGSVVTISLDNAKFEAYKGLREVTGIAKEDIVEIEDQKVALNITKLSVAEVLTGDYQSMYVALENVEPQTEAAASSKPAFTDGTNSVATNFRAAWPYASKTLSKVKGTLSGVVSYYDAVQIVPINYSDIADFVMPEVKLSDATLENASGSTAQITVTTEEGQAWTATASGTGFSISPASGTGSGTITVTASADGGTSEAQLGTVTVTLTQYPSISATANVSQRGSVAPAYTTVWEDDFSSCTANSSTALTSLSGSSDGFGGAYSGLSAIYPGAQCIKIGGASKAGSITTPALSAIPAGKTAKLTVTFYADGWNNKSCTLTLTANNAGTASEAQAITSMSNAAGNSPTLSKENQYTFTVTGATAETTLTFATNLAAMFSDLKITAEIE